MGFFGRGRGFPHEGESNRAVPAINRNGSARDPRRFVAGQIDGGMGDIFGLAKAAEWMKRDALLARGLRIRRVVDELRDEFRVHDSRTDSIHADLFMRVV